jgi:hypothetical protein
VLSILDYQILLLFVLLLLFGKTDCYKLGGIILLLLALSIIASLIYWARRLSEELLCYDLGTFIVNVGIPKQSNFVYMLWSLSAPGGDSMLLCVVCCRTYVNMKL